MEQQFLKRWYGKPGVLLALAPLSGLFVLFSGLRRLCYRWGWCRSEQPAAVVVVIGNVTVGGSGKTPLVIALVEQLRARGIAVGVISRGYGGQQRADVTEVHASDAAAQVGDEPLLIKRRTCVPVFVGRKRAEVAKALLAAYPQVQVILTDDGLQHYALQRDLEIAVVDGQRQLGNGWRLPVGPLRESSRRLQSVDWVISNGHDTPLTPHTMQLVPSQFVRIDAGERCEGFAEPVVALAGIGNPERFFTTLRQMGVALADTHAVPDHQAIGIDLLTDIRQRKQIAVVTEKDAVKLSPLIEAPIWYLPVDAQLPEPFVQAFLQRITQLIHHRLGTQ